ncbi:hypothetical protein [Roseobacter sp.]|uniref:hypothetical protein n=1 Tax=Roseobacter sp. TaxID=1907202 RepID=UPI00385DF793
MSYSPVPTPDEKTVGIFKPASRLPAFFRKRPVAAWCHLWVVCLLIAVFEISAKGIDAAFERHRSGAVFMLYAVLGWTYPSFLWVRQKKVAQ